MQQPCILASPLRSNQLHLNTIDGVNASCTFSIHSVAASCILPNPLASSQLYLMTIAAVFGQGVALGGDTHAAAQ